jgi:predicted Zn-dependent protease
MSIANIKTKAKAIKQKIEEKYQGYDKETNTYYFTWVNLKYSSSIDPEKDFALIFNDAPFFIDKKGDIHFADGLVDEIGNTKVNRMQVRSVNSSAGGVAEEMTSERQASTGAHEVGHALGLKHNIKGSNLSPNGNYVDENNMMNPNSKDDNITIDQLKTIVKTIDNNNKIEK